jgi:uncharacterized protein (TIGR00369 family)
VGRKNLEIFERLIAGTLPPDEQSGILLPPPICRTIPFRVTHIEPGACVVELTTDPAAHANPMGTVHGGVFCTIADAAMGIAHWVGLEEGESFTSIDFGINFFRPVWSDELKATARVINGGRSVSYYGCELTRGDGKLVAHATSTVMTLRGSAAEGR